MEIQTRVALAELWLRDDLENIYALLFRFLGFGFWLAMSNVGWHVTQKFVILVPDPIAFAPWPVLLDPGELCDICQHTSFRPLFKAVRCGCVLGMRQQRTGKSVDRRPVSFVFVFVLFVTRRAKTASGREGAGRSLSEDLFSEWEERKKSRAERWCAWCT